MPLIGWAAIINAVHDWWWSPRFLFLLGRQLYLETRSQQSKTKRSKRKQKPRLRMRNFAATVEGKPVYFW